MTHLSFQLEFLEPIMMSPVEPVGEVLNGEGTSGSSHPTQNFIKGQLMTAEARGPSLKVFLLSFPE